MNRNLFWAIPFALCFFFIISCKKDSDNLDVVNPAAVSTENVIENTDINAADDRSSPPLCTYEFTLISGSVKVYGFGGVFESHTIKCHGVPKTAWLRRTFTTPGVYLLSTATVNNPNLVRVVGLQAGTFCSIKPVGGLQTLFMNLGVGNWSDFLVNQPNCAVISDNCE